MRWSTRAALTEMRPPFGRELDGIRQEIPQHLLQTRGVRQDIGVLHVPRRVDRDVLGLRCRPHALERGLEHRHHRQRLELDLQLAGRHARHVDEVVHELRLRLGVAIDQFEGVPSRLLAEVIVEQHARPAEDHVQRRAELVRQRRQELVLQTVGLAQPPFGAFVRQVGDDDGDGADAVDGQGDRRQLRRIQRHRRQSGVGPPPDTIPNVSTRCNVGRSSASMNSARAWPAMRSGGRAISSAKRWLQYRIVPSAASVSAPSRICSTIRR